MDAIANDAVTKESKETESSMSMNNQEAINIIQALVNGINPLSDEPLPANDLCLNSDIERALQAAIPALESRIRYDERQAKLPANAGKPWTDEEDYQLTKAFDDGNLSLPLLNNMSELKAQLLHGWSSLVKSLAKALDTIVA